MDWIREYGLWSVLIGAILEGDWVMLAASALVHEELLSFLGAWLVGGLGAYIGHIIFYCVGRYLKFKNIFSPNPKWKPRIDRALSLIRTYPLLSIFFLQYIYGMRLAGAIALGFSEMPWFTFLSIQIPNCLIWSGVILTIGYGATEAILAWLSLSGKSLTVLGVAVLLATSFLYILFRKPSLWKRKSRLPSP